MKCNIKKGQMQERKVIKCCICGEEITVRESNNPYPVREWSAIGTDKNRCCHSCNHDIVTPSRIVGNCAKNQDEYDNYHRNLKSMPYSELKKIFTPNAVA